MSKIYSCVLCVLAFTTALTGDAFAEACVDLGTTIKLGRSTQVFKGVTMISHPGSLDLMGSSEIFTISPDKSKSPAIARQLCVKRGSEEKVCNDGPLSFRGVDIVIAGNTAVMSQTQGKGVKVFTLTYTDSETIDENEARLRWDQTSVTGNFSGDGAKKKPVYYGELVNRVVAPPVETIRRSAPPSIGGIWSNSVLTSADLAKGNWLKSAACTVPQKADVRMSQGGSSGARSGK